MSKDVVLTLSLLITIINFIPPINALPRFYILEGIPGSTYDFQINRTHGLEISYPEIYENIEDPYRLEVSSSNAHRHDPLFVVVRQKQSVMSWQLPLLVETPNPHSPEVFVKYYHTGRTLCNNATGYGGSKLQPSNKDRSKIINVSHTNFTVTLSTFSEINVLVTIRTKQVSNYMIQTGETNSATFSPSEPVYYAYTFPDNDVKSVRLQIKSRGDVCFTVSVQPNICPIYDLMDHITYQGKFQTVSKHGGLVIHRKDFEYQNESSFVIVFVAHADNYKCENSVTVKSKASKSEKNRQITHVQFSVKMAKKIGEYSIAILSLLGFNLIVSLIIIVLTYIFYRFGNNASDHTDNNQDNNIKDVDAPLGNDVIDSRLNHPTPTLDQFIQSKERNRRSALNYFWHIANIAIFYGLPVMQLMIFYQRAVNYTGNLDLCYYNNQCSHPLYFNDFNHVYSNLGYVVFGLLFLAITAFRNYYVHNPDGCGIPKFYGLYYAMGVALVFEGVLSACYHICPNQSNFQFDTSFMYVMAMLIMTKLYQNRHPSILASAYSTFTVLGLGVTVAMLGIIYNSLGVQIVFFVSYLIFCVYMAFKLYFFANVKRRIGELYEDLKNNRSEYRNILKPLRLKLFIFVVVGLVINFAMAISGFFLYPHTVDFGTYLLIILMGNAILYSMYYMTMKCLLRERICFEAILYGVLALGLWIFGGYFFFNAATVWSKTPAQSRLLNKGCLLLDFYDTHDIWHILSAPALFFTFAFLSAMDNDLVNIKHDKIKVF